MNFFNLRELLLMRLRRMLETGAVSESTLARRLGVSQPHLHNTLKGVRGVTMQMADQFLESMGWSVLDLIELPDLESAAKRGRALRSGRQARLDVWPIAALVQPGLEPAAKASVPRDILCSLPGASVYVLDEDTDCGGFGRTGDLLVTHPHLPDNGTAVCVLATPGPATLSRPRLSLRTVTRGANTYYSVEPAALAAAAGGAVSSRPVRFTPVQTHQVLARIHAISRRRSGMFQPPAPLSDAS
jgi:plasmid maintenance system antidote protein VapI